MQAFNNRANTAQPLRCLSGWVVLVLKTAFFTILFCFIIRFYFQQSNTGTLLLLLSLLQKI